jgi:hypothetical protein
VIDPEEMIGVLKKLVSVEARISIAWTTADHHTTMRDLAIALAVDKLIPCILHMKL